ncbi:MAG: phenylacetate--CoA ligase family protein [Thermoleophilia bacterium]
MSKATPTSAYLELKKTYLRRISFFDEYVAINNLSKSEFLVWQLDNVIEQLQYAKRNSALYGELLTNINVDDIKTWGDFKSLVPFTTKEHLKTNSPFGVLALDIKDTARYGESTGTTGRPVSSFVSADDWWRNSVFGLQHWTEIFDSSDLVITSVPYELAFVGQDLDRALETIGCSIVACGVLTKFCPWERVLELLHDLQANALICSPGRAIRFADMAEAHGWDPRKDFHLEKILCTGDGSSPAKLAMIGNIWGANVYSGFGMTETNSLALPCKSGEMHLSEERYYFEVVQIEGKNFNPQRGELVITSLQSEAMPLIRYRTGDVVEINDEPCGCLRTTRRLKHYGRINDVLVFNNDHYVPLMEIDQVIMATTGVGKYYTLLYSPKLLTVNVEIVGNTTMVRKNLVDSLTDLCHTKIVIRNVAKEQLISIWDSSLKPGIIVEKASESS